MIPNPDIAGIGVRIAFVSTAYLTLVMILLYYMVDSYSETTSQHLPNPVDRSVLEFVWRKLGRPSNLWEKELQKVVLMFSDQQLVTGIAILGSGYSQLRCGLSSYHWQITAYLAWFSSVTHLATLTALRQYFRKYPVIRNWRACFMIVLAVMLGVSLVPTGSEEWSDSLPAQCYFGEYPFSSGPNNTPPMAISIFVLSISYLTRLIKFSIGSSMFARKWLRIKPGNFLKRVLDRMKCHSANSRINPQYTPGNADRSGITCAYHSSSPAHPEAPTTYPELLDTAPEQPPRTSIDPSIGECTPDTRLRSKRVWIQIPSKYDDKAKIRNTLTTHVQDRFYGRNFYDYEWFLVLIALIILLYAQGVALLLYLTARGETKLESGSQWIIRFFLEFFGWIWVVVVLLALVGYTAIFVILEDFKYPIREFLEKRCQIKRDFQRKCFRYVPYILLVASLLSTSLSLVIPIKSLLTTLS
ncbi:hypothetical protein GP486_002781 [Trichoglossum hirsutum]|uniref:Uncharacterized protein n=1 Tax=Trichoglossum hirsutum TaxID=265104 RepID=A0A9P8RRE1_9PEZI|nr:hypothetical protein GP486_002781 [Trichoglossum hirsutum]